MDIKIIIAAHKPYWMPPDHIYFPIHVGKTGKKDIGFPGDDTGDNISQKNPNYCELTGLYWAWKNLDADYIGLAHYRRHFSLKKGKDKKASVLTREQLEPILTTTDVILPKRRDYYIETIYSHYAHTHDGTHLDKTKAIISERFPDYLESFDRVMKSRGGHRFNMLIMKRELLNEYCAWLFEILFELEKQIDTSGMTAFDARLFGRVSECLLDVWIYKNHVPYKEINYIYMEPIKWVKKIGCFLGAKFMGRKYSTSF